MFNINNQMISEGCYRSQSLSLGEEYYSRGAVHQLEYYANHRFFRGYVQGTERYGFIVYFDEEDHLQKAACSCPDYNNHPGYFCKHLVATLLAIKDYEYVDPKIQSAKEVTKRLFSSLATSLEDSATQELNCEITYNLETFYRFENRSYLELKIGLDKLYVVKNIKKFLEALKNKEEIVFGKFFTFNPFRHKLKSEDNKVIDLLQEIYAVEQYDNLSFREKSESLFSGKKVYLPDPFIERLFSYMQDRTLNINIDDYSYQDVPIVKENLPLYFELKKEESNLKVASDAILDFNLLTENGSYVFYRGKIYQPSREQIKNMLPFYRSFKESYQNSLVIFPEDKERFISEVVPYLERAGQVEITPSLADEIIKLPLKAFLYLDMEDNILWGNVKFHYGERVINPFAPENQFEEERILVRDVEKEKRILSLLGEANFYLNNNKIYLENEEDIFNFFTEFLPLLQKDLDIYYSKRLYSFSPVSMPSFSGKLSLNNETGMLDFSFAVEGVEREELYEVFKAYREKKRYYRLSTGAFLALENEEVSDMDKILNILDFTKADFLQEIKQLPKHQALFFDQLLEEKQLQFMKRNRAFRELTQSVREPEELEFSIPTHLESLLRDYQKVGYKWLKNLAHYGFGGILADEMGLGKTLQVITYILAERENSKEPVLVVAPTSLLYNWQLEVEKFAPTLKTLLIVGNKQERKKLFEEMENFDLIITSYPLLQRDVEEYLNYHFSYCILDEAQYIKNPHSQRAKAVKMLRANNYLALTGTPIENSLLELWSIFEFIMPGYLPPYQVFIKKYLNPIEKEGNTEKIQDLARLVRPFVLRRVKEDVLKELPAKIENKMISELTREQKKIYLAYRERISKEIDEEIKEKGLAKSRIKILAGLTRLRQICCHPGLFIENYLGESGKLEQLKEVLQEIISSGHRVLIFSQFTSMLAIIKKMLKKENYTYFYIDGSVKAEERMKRVTAFNEGERDIFLISLKAGGTGLNLTGADIVIHFDPWWNPAVEDQASDRAHRLGQKKVVQVLKFIARGTIEEKIYELQQKKKELIDKVIEPGETMLSSLSEKEIYELLDM